MIRIGNGFDLHVLENGRDFILGGVKIDYSMGFKGHSDGDVLVHSIIDSLCGAAGLPNIGQLFPDNDPQYKGISSMILLEKTMEMICKKGFSLVNIDNIIICEKPKLNPYLDMMKTNLCKVMKIESEQISIKPKTSEGVGIIGEGKAVAVISAVLLSLE